MAEWVLGHMIAHERHFVQWNGAQRERRWKSADPNYEYRTLRGLNVGVLGASGSIGQALTRAFHFFGMNVRGLASHTTKAAHDSDKAANSSSSSPPSLYPASSDSSTPAPVTWFYTSPAPNGTGPAVIPPDFLHELDYLVNALPSTPSTRFMLGSDESPDVLSACRKGAAKFPRTVFINIGRGDVVSETALLRALLGSAYEGRLSSPHSSPLPIPSSDAYLAAAVLDVFIEEPLPSSHRFYSLAPPLLTVFPHVSGLSSSAREDITDVFVQNLHRFTQQQPLSHEVDKQKGY